MATVNEKMTAIADNIRDKTGRTNALTLDDMASGVNEVYEAGQNSMIDESKIIEKTVSGKKYIAVDDVSELPHKVNVQLSSETISDFSDVKVTRYGSNFFDCINAEPYSNGSWTDGTDTILSKTENSITVQKKAAGNWSYARFKLPDVLEGKTITISAEWECSGANKGGIRVNWEQQLNSEHILADSYTSGTPATGVVTSKPNNSNCITLLLYGNASGPGVTGDTVTYRNITVNVGGKKIPFEPYVETVFTANVDGLVDGIRSISPSMMIASDADVDITMDYNMSYGMQTEYDRFWNVNQEYGNRKDYDFAYTGRGWNDTTFDPPYNITVEKDKGTYVFRGSYITDLEAILKKRNISIIIEGGNCSYFFYYSKITVSPEIDASLITNFYGFYAGCSKLHTVRKITFKEDKDISTTIFHGCTSLVNLEIGGLIGSNFSVSQSPLSTASIVSVIEHLWDGASGKTATFKQTAVDNMTFPYTSPHSGITYNSWDELIATKQNWTIALSA